MKFLYWNARVVFMTALSLLVMALRASSELYQVFTLSLYQRLARAVERMEGDFQAFEDARAAKREANA